MINWKQRKNSVQSTRNNIYVNKTDVEIEMEEKNDNCVIFRLFCCEISKMTSSNVIWLERENFVMFCYNQNMKQLSILRNLPYFSHSLSL